MYTKFDENVNNKRKIPITLNYYIAKNKRDKPETANTQSLFFKWTVDCFNKFIVTVTVAICTI